MEEEILENTYIKRSLPIYHRLTRSLKTLIGVTSTFEEAQALLAAKGVQEDFEKGLRGLLFRSLQAVYRLGQDHATTWVDLRKFAEAVPKPEEAIAFMRVQSFAIARVEDEELKKEVQVSLVKALEEGQTYDEWKKNVDTFFDARGVTKLNFYHARFVFRNNMMHAYNAGRWAIFHDPDVVEAFPYFRYEAIMDEVTSPLCQALDAKIYHRDHPIWKRIWPPNHHRCRSTVSPVSEETLQAEGLEVSEAVPQIRDPEGNWKEAAPEKGFDSDPPVYAPAFANWLREKGYIQEAKTVEDVMKKSLKAPRFKTVQEAEGWCTERWPETTFDFKGMDPQCAQEVVDQWIKLSQVYPYAAEELKYLGTYAGKPSEAFKSLAAWKNDKGTYAWAVGETHEIGLNPKWFGDHKGFTESLEGCVSSKWHPKECNSPGMVFVHEFGHHVNKILRSLPPNWAFVPVVRASGFGIISETKQAFLTGNQALRKEISEYAKANNSEGWAESFVISHGEQRRKEDPAYVQHQQRFLELVSRENWRDAGKKQWKWQSDLPSDERTEAGKLATRLIKELGISETY